jgi:hypothetical protein
MKVKKLVVSIDLPPCLIDGLASCSKKKILAQKFIKSNRLNVDAKVRLGNKKKKQKWFLRETFLQWEKWHLMGRMIGIMRQLSNMSNVLRMKTEVTNFMYLYADWLKTVFSA